MVEAANMGDADAQYELGCRLRVEVGLYLANRLICFYILNLHAGIVGNLISTHPYEFCEKVP